MSEIKLSRKASDLLYALHKNYKKQLKNGVMKEQAIIFGGSLEIQQDIMLDCPLAEIIDACYELDKADLLNCIPGDDDIQLAILTNSGIDFAENRYTNGAKTVWNLIKEIFSIIPFLGG